MSVTAICTLWGRPLHTLRWMWHMNRIRFPHSILLADGGPENGLEDVLRDHSLFPDLSYEYLRFRDRSVDDYFAKVVSAGTHATTPYVMLCDNDDFVLPSGISPAIDLLDRDPLVVVAGGRVVCFTLTRRHFPTAMDGVRATVSGYFQGGTFETVGEHSALDRACHQIDRGVYGTYYSLQRREVFIDSWTRLRASGIRNIDIGVGEFLACQVLTHGKGVQNPAYVIHMRQMGSSSVGATLPTSSERWGDPKWQADLARMGQVIGASIAAVDGIDPKQAEQRIIEAMTNKRRPKPTDFVSPTGLSGLARRLFRVSGGRQMLEHWRIVQENLRRAEVHRYSLDQALSELTQCGADSDYLARHRSDVAEMERTLASTEMAEFVATHAKRITLP